MEARRADSKRALNESNEARNASPKAQAGSMMSNDQRAASMETPERNKSQHLPQPQYENQKEDLEELRSAYQDYEPVRNKKAHLSYFDVATNKRPSV